jgi:DNA-binding MarR family transcriptional regulator
VTQLSRLASDAAECERGWRERIRAALVAILEFMDEQPCWARLLVLDPPVAQLAICERKQRAQRSLARALERETHERLAGLHELAPAAASPRLTAEMVVGGVVSVVRARMLAGAREPLVQLAPSLMSFITRPYQRIGREVPVRQHLPVRTTYRTTCVLRAIGESPRSNNREIADAAGVRDEGQTSKLLSRLEQRGLVQNVGLGATYGEPNAWLLTASGQRVLQATRERDAVGSRVPAEGTVGGAA